MWLCLCLHFPLVQGLLQTLCGVVGFLLVTLLVTRYQLQDDGVALSENLHRRVVSLIVNEITKGTKLLHVLFEGGVGHS